MKKKICLVSRCVSESNEEVKFHFKGYYMGVKITEVVLCKKSGKFCPSFILKEDYLLFLEIIEIKNTILVVNHLKSNNILDVNI